MNILSYRKNFTKRKGGKSNHQFKQHQGQQTLWGALGAGMWGDLWVAQCCSVAPGAAPVAPGAASWWWLCWNSGSLGTITSMLCAVFRNRQDQPCLSIARLSWVSFTTSWAREWTARGLAKAPPQVGWSPHSDRAAQRAGDAHTTCLLGTGLQGTSLSPRPWPQSLNQSFLSVFWSLVLPKTVCGLLSGPMAPRSGAPHPPGTGGSCALRASHLA